MIGHITTYINNQLGKIKIAYYFSISQPKKIHFKFNLQLQIVIIEVSTVLTKTER